MLRANIHVWIINGGVKKKVIYPIEFDSVETPQNSFHYFNHYFNHYFFFVHRNILIQFFLYLARLARHFVLNKKKGKAAEPCRLQHSLLELYMAGAAFDVFHKISCM